MSLKRKLHFWVIILSAIFTWIFNVFFVTKGLPLIFVSIFKVFITLIIFSVIAFLIWIYKEETKYYENIKCN